MMSAKAAARFFRGYEVLVDGVATLYRVYEPPSASVAAPLPVILFLHGAGEAGTDGVAPTTVGIGPAIRAAPQRFPALVVFPQTSRGYGWREFNLAAAFAALDDAQSRHETDRTRVSVTGISMGGLGTWMAALTQPERFAAAVPVCGGLDRIAALRAGILRDGTEESVRRQAAERIAAIPHWAFHGDTDQVIPVMQSATMVEALRDAGASVRYTVYPGVRHNSWDRAYAEPELLPWMLGQIRK